ncbi:group II intron reverse transcriptase domain-containing protein [archaeon]|nr:group II intron reverse transcriptase domain-containing protein [archaeon]
METYTKLYQKVCSEENIELAWKKARKRKTLKHYVIEFEKNLKSNLAILRTELLLHAYRPRPLETFILRDPKTRKISVSEFRDRIVHHAICNVIEPIFEKKFIYDSYANRKGKGTLAALNRLKVFMKKVTRNGTLINKYNNRDIKGFFLKGDIKHYFDTASHDKLSGIISRTIKDKELLFLIKNILKNHNSNIEGKGMPLGNLTSQFLANVYLNELDQFVKHKLKVQHYIRYVDDFIILHNDKNKLEFYKEEINNFLEQKLSIHLSLEKSKIMPISRGIQFLGFRNFYYHRLLKQRNIRKFYRKLTELKIGYNSGTIDYDTVYESLQGWTAFAKKADSYKLRTRISNITDEYFPGEISTIELNKLIKIF